MNQVDHSIVGDESAPPPPPPPKKRPKRGAVVTSAPPNPIAVALTDGLWGVSTLGIRLGSRGRLDVTPIAPDEREQLARSVEVALAAYSAEELLPPWAVPLVALGAIMSQHVVPVPTPDNEAT